MAVDLVVQVAPGAFAGLHFVQQEIASVKLIEPIYTTGIVDCRPVAPVAGCGDAGARVQSAGRVCVKSKDA